MQSIDWYRDYIRFLAALKNRLTIWHEKEKWKPALPSHILEKLKEVRKVKNRFYHKRYEEDRIRLRNMSKEVKEDIFRYRSDR
jgi:hypothetical protein